MQLALGEDADADVAKSVFMAGICAVTVSLDMMSTLSDVQYVNRRNVIVSV